MMLRKFWKTVAVAAAAIAFAGDTGPVMAADGDYKTVEAAKADCDKSFGDDFLLVMEGCTFVINADGAADADKVHALGRRSLGNLSDRRYRSAATDLQRAVELQPNDRALHVALARGLARIADHDGAARAYDKALTLPTKDGDPGNTDDESILNQIIVWRCTIGDADKAMAAYRDLGSEDIRESFRDSVTDSIHWGGDRDTFPVMTEAELTAYFATGCHDLVYNMFSQELPGR